MEKYLLSAFKLISYYKLQLEYNYVCSAGSWLYNICVYCKNTRYTSMSFHEKKMFSTVITLFDLTKVFFFFSSLGLYFILLLSVNLVAHNNRIHLFNLFDIFWNNFYNLLDVWDKSWEYKVMGNFPKVSLSSHQRATVNTSHFYIVFKNNPQFVRSVSWKSPIICCILVIL